jgi:hypothetical protein
LNNKSNELENEVKLKDKKMSVMRINDDHLKEILLMCEWIIKETDSSNIQNIRAKKITSRIVKFLKQTGNYSVMTNLKKEKERITLDNF